MKTSVLVKEGFDSKNQQFHVYKLIDPLFMNLDNDQLPFTIDYVKVILSNDSNYQRTLVMPCDREGVIKMQIVLLLMAGVHQSFYMLNVLGYSADFQTGLDISK